MRSPHKSFLSLESLQMYVLKHMTKEEAYEAEKIMILEIFISVTDIFPEPPKEINLTSCEMQPTH